MSARDAWTKRVEELERKKISNVEPVVLRRGDNRSGNVAKAGRLVAAVSAAPIDLPWPPTGNHAVKHANGAHYLRDEVITYRNVVAAELCKRERVRGKYALEIDLSPPDGLRRDADNALKSVLDACVKCGWLPDDSMSYMKQLHVYVKDDRRGRVLLRVLPVEAAA